MRLIHWNYFPALEDDLLRLARFVEFDRENFSAFSTEMAHLLLASCSEVDVVLKAISKRFEPKAKADCEQGYRAVVPKHLPSFTKVRIEMRCHGLTFAPWSAWDSNKTPEWWTGYNKVKHHRDSSFRKANLCNALNSMAGLFVCVLHLYRDLANKGEIVPGSRLFLPEEAFIDAVTEDIDGTRLIYKL